VGAILSQRPLFGLIRDLGLPVTSSGEGNGHALRQAGTLHLARVIPAQKSCRRNAIGPGPYSSVSERTERKVIDTCVRRRYEVL